MRVHPPGVATIFPKRVFGCSDRIVWTYNAPATDHHKFCHTLSNGSSSSHSNTSPTSSSPLHSGSPASPTSVSSSVMSSQSGSRRLPYAPSAGSQPPANGDYSVSEAISNISSPDYHDDDSMGIRDCVMEISDHSDSDSTLLVSEPRQRHRGEGDHRIVIQVKGPDKDSVKDRGKGACCDTNHKNKGEAQAISYQVGTHVFRSFVCCCRRRHTTCSSCASR